MTSTPRERAKAERYQALLREAARLFAERGYSGVSLDDIGHAVGVSGPAVYRHVESKQALLGAILIRASENLVDGANHVAAHTQPGVSRMRALIRFHVEFALTNADIIRVQDRELPNLTEHDREAMRRLQRTYIVMWIKTLGMLRSAIEEELRLRVQACFGLLNSTPHSASAAARAQQGTAQALTAMAEAALLSE
jgi:AcrR family transcriptional regulator